MIPNHEVIGHLHQSDWQVILRGRRLSDQLPVLLKSSREGHGGVAGSDLLEREYNLLRDLSLNGVPRVIELVQADGGFWLAMEDQGGVPLSQLIEMGPLDLDDFFTLAISLTETLGELHRRDIIHRNINPGGVLYDHSTGGVWLSDLSLAVRAAGEAAPNALLLKSVVTYASPEQTGRMNRAVDYRTDFYSLGVTLYEVLTGCVPFSTDDLLKLMHWHIARPPRIPTELNRKIPQALSEIIIKLLAKTPDERYQSARGLLEDLETCRDAWQREGRIAAFPLGRRDVSDRFRIPQKLYGREKDVEQLISGFRRACEGETGILLVTGYSGIGKTSLIHELYKPIIRQRGYFISGKFDQVVRGVPFGALIQALRGLVGQLLSESEDRLNRWRSDLSAALGANGGVLSEVIPEIDLILGKQPPAPALGPTEALNRFQLVFQNFVGALARKEHPLVLFLDDLQWADPATLSLLQPLLTSPAIQSLFVIGAYRDNEVDVAHPLSRVLGTLESEGVTLSRVTLEPLRLPDLTAFVRDTLQSDMGRAVPLAELISEKTSGNPFFVIQFLKTLKQENLLSFDYQDGSWRYSIGDISRAAMTDNVIDLMTRKIRMLGPETQRALTLASCIGSPFDLRILAGVSGQSEVREAKDLEEAIAAGLILRAEPLGESAAAVAGDQAHSMEQSAHSDEPLREAAFVFLHDRVQQAAYALIPAEEKQTVHLSVGRSLLESTGKEGIEDRLFDVVHHLNLGSELIEEGAARLELAELNLDAARKAKSSTAYEAARDYLRAGVRLLTGDDWNVNYSLAFALNLECAECENLCGDFEKAEADLATLLTRAATNLDRARVYSLRIVQSENQSRYSEALTTCRDCLALFGVSFPDADAERESALETEIASIGTLLADRPIESLVDLPVMTDPEMRMVMNVLTTIWSSAYISGAQRLTRLISATMVRLSLEYGNAEESAYGYATHTITVGPVRGDYKAAFQFGCLALRINEKFNDTRRRAKIFQQFQAHANLWRMPLRTCLPYAREASRSGFETGDFTYGIYGAFTETWIAIAITQDLARFVSDYTPNLALFEKLKVASVGDAQRILINWAKALRGQTASPTSLSDDRLDEADYLARYGDNPFFTVGYAVTKLQLCYLFGDHRGALAAGRLGRGIIHHLEGTIWPVTFEFWNGLALAANFETATPADRLSYRAELARARELFEVLAENCAENYFCQWQLLSAEIERIEGNALQAIEHYERATAFAKETGAIQYEALSAELCERLWRQRGQGNVANAFRSQATACYEKWGARAKADAMREGELHLRDSPEVKTDVRSPGVPSVDAQVEGGRLDHFSVIKAAQAIGSEIELERLLDRLIRITIENAGAERGCLMLEHDGHPLVHGEGSLDDVQVRLRQGVPLREMAVPLSIVNFVRRTHESVVLADASSDDRYGGDEDVLRRRLRSVMCLPVLNQARLIGVLYLENNMINGAFTPERIEVCRMLASQAAISLKNALLYDEMRDEAAHRREAEETLRAITEGTAAVTGSDFFASLVRQLAKALHVRYAFVTECHAVKPEEPGVTATTLAFWMGDRLADNVTYEIAETPCLKVLAGETCHYPAGVQQLFPNDHDLVDLSAVGYLGVPLSNAAGAVIGHLAVLDDKPMEKVDQALSLLTIFAARAGAELERKTAEEGLQLAMTEVERLKNRLHAENVYLQEEIRREHNFDEIVGSDQSLLEVLQQVERVAPTDATVLIHGETGTGKELIARAIHDRSSRRSRPLVKVNCGAISAGLVESELFGHVKGAFTGAIDRRSGRFELADGGTLFLDEVGELPLDTQVKLLRVLQEGEFEPVGSSKTVKVDVRIIAATNRDLETEVKAGRFRADLFYRLNVLPLCSPPLRERRSDIPQLAMFFLSRAARRFGRSMDGISQSTIDLMMRYDWPGNIRELQNLIERGVVLNSGSVLSIPPSFLMADGDHVTASAQSQSKAGTRSRSGVLPASASHPVTPTAPLGQVEREHIINALTQSRWVIEGERGAAFALGLHPNTLRSRLKKLGIKRPTH